MKITEISKQKINTGLIIGITILVLLLVSYLLHLASHYGGGNSYEVGYEVSNHLRSLVESISFKNGIRIGSVIAILTSWERNKSIRWTILHALFGWLYVIYFVWTRKAKGAII